MTEGDDDLMLWRQLLEVDLAEEEMVDPGWEEDDVDRESRERVFARVGIADAQASPRVVVEFLLDLESWLAAAAPQTALARDVGSIVDTLDLTLPELSAAGFGDSVEVECDLDSAGRVSELSVLIHGAAGPGLYLVLLGQDGGDVVAPVSQYGLARFIGLSIDVRSSRMLAFELRG
jgi:hypothetical protein